MKAPSRILHHKSLTLSLVALFFALIATSFLPEYGYRTQHHPELATVLAGLAVCTLTLLNLIRDNRNGYPSFRCSLATILLALALGPIAFLGFLLTAWFH